MPLPPSIEATVSKRFDDLIADAASIIESMKHDNQEGHDRQRGSGVLFLGEIHYQETAYHALVTKTISLIQLILGTGGRGKQVVDDIRKMHSGSTETETILGVLRGLKDDFEAGMLTTLHEIIETNIVSDYMGQAEQLLGEGIPGQYDYVPAAVLAGAVFEDALRRLCLRQAPPIELTLSDGKPKTLDPLITDLQKSSAWRAAPPQRDENKLDSRSDIEEVGTTLVLRV